MKDKTGIMKWIRDDSGENILHLKPEGKIKWTPYFESELGLPDQDSFSPGYPTFHSLFKQGWKLTK
jgi:hypothetical protein